MSQGMDYHVDLVFCIDTTGSMEPFIDEVRNHSLSLPDELRATLNSMNKDLSQLRIRVITFRDVRCDNPAITTSRFFCLPQELAQFQEHVRSMDTAGGQGLGASGLHAIGTALMTDWTTAGFRRRHIVVLWTDTYTHELDSVPYPADLVSDYPNTSSDLIDTWESSQGSSSLQANARRLILFAPDDPSWNRISESWEQTVHVPSQAGRGLRT